MRIENLDDVNDLRAQYLASGNVSDEDLSACMEVMREERKSAATPTKKAKAAAKPLVSLLELEL